MPGYFDDFEVEHTEPKDLKRSIWDKHRRRLRHLRDALAAYTDIANQRLDKDKAGNIRNREETEKLLHKCEEMLALIPDEKS